MATETDRLKREIDATRQDLARDMDRLAEHAKPAQLARQVGRIRDGLRSVKDRVVGASDDAAAGVGAAAADLEGAVRQAPATVARMTSGSPVAVGIIAFGGGLLAAALIPESKGERRAVRQLSENLGPVTEPLQRAGSALVDDVRTSVRAATGDVRSAAVDAAANVGSAVAAGAADVRTAAGEAATHTLHDAAVQGRAVIDQGRRSFED